MQEVRRLRQERGWTQTQLAFHSGLAPSVISQIENDRRDPSAGTLRKLAEALGVAVGDLFPKGQAPLPDFDGERRSEVVEALLGPLERWHARRLATVKDPTSLHFRDPTSAAVWIAETQEEAQDFCEWLDEFIGEHLHTVRSLEDISALVSAALVLDNPAKLGEMRLQEMADKPDELAARRMERATAAAQASMKRLQDLGKAANG